jgi:hypothetical protein
MKSRFAPRGSKKREAMLRAANDLGQRWKHVSATAKQRATTAGRDPQVLAKKADDAWQLWRELPEPTSNSDWRKCRNLLSDALMQAEGPWRRLDAPGVLGGHGLLEFRDSMRTLRQRLLRLAVLADLNESPEVEKHARDCVAQIERLLPTLDEKNFCAVPTSRKILEFVDAYVARDGFCDRAQKQELWAKLGTNLERASAVWSGAWRDDGFDDPLSQIIEELESSILKLVKLATARSPWEPIFANPVESLLAAVFILVAGVNWLTGFTGPVFNFLAALAGLAQILSLYGINFEPGRRRAVLRLVLMLLIAVGSPGVVKAVTRLNTPSINKSNPEEQKNPPKASTEVNAELPNQTMTGEPKHPPPSTRENLSGARSYCESIGWDLEGVRPAGMDQAEFDQIEGALIRPFGIVGCPVEPLSGDPIVKSSRLTTTPKGSGDPTFEGTFYWYPLELYGVTEFASETKVIEPQPGQSARNIIREVRADTGLDGLTFLDTRRGTNCKIVGRLNGRVFELSAGLANYAFSEARRFGALPILLDQNGSTSRLTFITPELAYVGEHTIEVSGGTCPAIGNVADRVKAFRQARATLNRATDQLESASKSRVR